MIRSPPRCCDFSCWAPTGRTGLPFLEQAFVTVLVRTASKLAVALISHPRL
jgi:hypothetical protein